MVSFSRSLRRTPLPCRILLRQGQHALERLEDLHISGGASMQVNLRDPPSSEVITKRLADIVPGSRSADVGDTRAGEGRKSSLQSGPLHVGRQPTSSASLPGGGGRKSRLSADSQKATSKKRLLLPEITETDFPENAADLDKPNEPLSPPPSTQSSPKRPRPTGGLSQTTE